MTEWNGIKTGGLCKLTGKGSRGPKRIAFVVSIEEVDPDANFHGPCSIVNLTMMVAGQINVVELRTYKGQSRKTYTARPSWLEWNYEPSTPK